MSKWMMKLLAWVIGLILGCMIGFCFTSCDKEEVVLPEPKIVPHTEILSEIKDTVIIDVFRDCTNIYADAYIVTTQEVKISWWDGSYPTEIKDSVTIERDTILIGISK